MMDIRLIKAFCAVYEEGSINKAAARLRIAQPSISTAIRHFETDLNTLLFHRGSAGVTPTVAAHDLYIRLQRILFDLEAARQAVTGQLSDIQGPLRIALPPRIAKSLLSTLIPRFLEDYPGVELSIMEVLPQRLVDFTIRGEVDFSIALAPPNDHRLAVRRLAAEPLVLIAARENADVPSGSFDLAAGQPLKLAVPTHYPLRGILDRHIQAGNIPVRRIINIEMIPAIIDLVRVSDWVTVLPASSMMGEQEKLLAREIASPQMTVEIFAVHSAHRGMSTAANALLLEISETLGSVDFQAEYCR